MDKLEVMHVGPIQEQLFDGTLNGYQKAATSTAVYFGQNSILGLMYAALQGAAEAGEFAGHLAKALREDGLANGLYVDGGVVQHNGTPLSEARRELMIKEVGDQLWYQAAKCNELGITLEDAAKRNIDKLADRQRRGVLTGSGDNR